MTSYRLTNSYKLHERACQSIVGGVNSPARAFLSVGGDPLFVKSAKGCSIWDVDGNSYIDYIGSWGPMIVGHAHPDVLHAINKTMSSGTSFGVSTELEILLSEKIRSMMPSIELLRMVNSGTEATMSALRLARGFTGKKKVIKFAGCYHGHGDSFLIKAGSGAMTYSIPGSAGVTPGTAMDTLIAPFNDLNSVHKIVSNHRGDIAAIIVEPVAGNMGTIPPDEGFLQGLKYITTSEHIVLIFDEVITGFRLARGGAQELYGVIPDITTLGKIVGGGFPVGVYGGRADIMNSLAPLGPVYQAGTLSGNPIACAAGLATLSLIDNHETYRELERLAGILSQGLSHIAKEIGIPVTINRVGSMMTIFFTEDKVRDYTSASASNTAQFSRFFRGLLNHGVLLPPSQFETLFVSTAHTDEVIEKTILSARDALKESIISL